MWNALLTWQPSTCPWDGSHASPVLPTCPQYFFLGHNDDISSIAICPAPMDLDGRQYPARTLVATGQVGHCAQFRLVFWVRGWW